MSWYNPIDDAKTLWNDTAGVVTDTASATEAVGKGVLATAEWVSNPHNWLRVLYVIGGSIAIFIGLNKMFNLTLPAGGGGAGFAASDAALAAA